MNNTDPTKNTTQKTKKTSNTDPTKNTTQKAKKMSNTDLTKNRYVNPGAREGLVPASYKTPTILLM